MIDFREGEKEENARTQLKWAQCAARHYQRRARLAADLPSGVKTSTLLERPLLAQRKEARAPLRQLSVASLFTSRLTFINSTSLNLDSLRRKLLLL